MAWLKRTGHSLTAAIERFQEEDGLEGVEIVPLSSYAATPITTTLAPNLEYQSGPSMRLASAYAIVQEWIHPVAFPPTAAQWPACFGRDSMPLPIPEKVAASVRMLNDPDSAWEMGGKTSSHRSNASATASSSSSSLSRSPSLLPKLYAAHVDKTVLLLPSLENEVRASLGRADQALKLGRDPIAAEAAAASELESMAGKVASALKCWATGLKALEGDYVNQFTTTITALLRASIASHDQGSEAFSRILTAWLRARTLPPRYVAPRGLPVPIPTAWKPNLLSNGPLARPVRDLFRLGIFASYSTVLSDLAHEEIDRLVRGEPIGAAPAPGSAEEATGAVDDVLDDEESPYAVRRLAGLERVVSERIVGWLGGFVGEFTIRYLDGTTLPATFVKRQRQKRPADTESFYAVVPSDIQPGVFAKRANIELRMKHRLQIAIYDQSANSLFDMIVDYPASRPALEDLREIAYVNKYIRRSRLVEALKDANARRLLVPGADTEIIIKQYVNIIRCLRIVDPAGVTLHAVAEPIRVYLRARQDTIKCMVAMLVDGDELAEEDEQDGTTDVRPVHVRNDEIEEWNDPRWEPEPMDAPEEYRSRRASDIISTLVGLYDSRDVIVTELQELLAKRLLEIERYELASEIKMVEILKLRFGEATLQVCEVMLKDLADSKRTDAHVQQEARITTLRPIILSRMYWPAMTTMRLKLPRELTRLQREYERAYVTFKQDKHLQWFRNHGTVVMEVELQDRSLEVNATPLQASVLEAFKKRKTRTLTSLARRVGVKMSAIEEEKMLRHAINFWINEGVLSAIFWDADGQESVKLNEELPDEEPIERSEIRESTLCG